MTDNHQQLLKSISPLLLILSSLGSLLCWTHPIGTSPSYFLFLILIILQPSYPLLFLLIYTFLLSYPLITSNNNLDIQLVIQHCHLLASIIFNFQKNYINFLSSFTTSSPQSSSFFLLSFTISLLLVYPFFSLIFLLTWLSPPVAWLRNILAYAVFPNNDNGKTLGYYLHSNRPKINPRQQEEPKIQMVIQIEVKVVEHQRWKEQQGWTEDLTEEDKKKVGGRWTDEQGREVEGLKTFKLPSSSTFVGSPSHPCSLKEVEVSWTWVDSEWIIGRSLLPLNHPFVNCCWDVDQDGWTYANHTWSSFSSSPTFNSFVRKRQWIRRVNCIFSTPSSLSSLVN